MKESTKKLLLQIIKFGIVGVIATIIDYAFLIFFTEVCKINPVISTGLSFIISLIANYLLSMKFVFKAKKNLSKNKEILIFVITSTIGLGLNELLMYIGKDVLKINYLIVKKIDTLVVMVWNYVSKKILIEGKQESEEDV